MSETATPVRVGARTRRFWRIGGSVLAAFVLASAAQGAISQVAREERTVLETYDAASVEELVVDTHVGEVEVIGTDTDRVSVTAQVTDGLVRTELDHRLEEGVLTLASRCPSLPGRFKRMPDVFPAFGWWCGVDYRVEVPAALATSVRTGSGDLVLRDMAGPASAEATAGNVEVSGGTGAVTASTSSGNVSVLGTDAATVSARSIAGNVWVELASPGEEIEARSSSGNVTVVVPDDPSPYRTDVDTSSGSISEQIRSDPGAERSISAYTTAGDVTLRYP